MYILELEDLVVFFDLWKTRREMKNSVIDMLRPFDLLVEILLEKAGLAIFKERKWYVFKMKCLLG